MNGQQVTGCPAQSIAILPRLAAAVFLVFAICEGSVQFASSDVLNNGTLAPVARILVRAVLLKDWPIRFGPWSTPPSFRERSSNDHSLRERFQPVCCHERRRHWPDAGHAIYGRPRLTARDLSDPAKNILAGTRLLAVLLRYYDGDLIGALAAYNARPRKLFAPLPSNGETPTYVAAILRYFWICSSRSQSRAHTAKATRVMPRVELMNGPPSNFKTGH